jgi:tRNA 2-thiouridine synthesizing protein D
MNFSLAIHGAPFTSAAAETAYRFTVAVLDEGHAIYRLFFYHDGVHNASMLAVLPTDENSLTARWQALISTHRLDAVACIAAATRRGILNCEEAKRLEKSAANLAPEFRLGGLGELVDATIHSDRLITFGS